MKHLAWIPLAIVILGCDPLVGGECADGYAPTGDRCVRADLTPQGPAGGTGGSPSDAGPTVGAGGMGGETGSGAGTVATRGEYCAPPLTACRGSCVDLSEDPLHCGACGHVCATGLCDAGVCEGTTPGHVVVIGMSYEQATPASRHLLGNALFLPLHEPLRVLELRGAADSGAFAQAHAAIDQQANQRNRVAQTEIVDSASEASARLIAQPFDVLLVHDQVGALSPSMVSEAIDLAPGLDTHQDRGGTVVVLATSPSMADLLAESGLLDVTTVTPVTGVLHNDQPSSALGLYVPSPFFASPTSSVLELSPSEAAEIVITHAGLPVAVHATVP